MFQAEIKPKRYSPLVKLDNFLAIEVPTNPRPRKYPKYPLDEFARRGDEIYERDIKSQVDNEENRGKLVLIDIETGAWEMDADEMVVSKRMDERLPDAQLWEMRVGHRGVHYIRKAVTDQSI